MSSRKAKPKKLQEISEIEQSGAFDLEGHFIRLGAAIDAVGAKRVVLDTLEALFSCFNDDNLHRSELRRLFRWLKAKVVTAVITAETAGSKPIPQVQCADRA